MSEERTLAELTVKELLALQVQLLMDIRDGIVANVATEDDGCPHPEDRRVSLSTPDDLGHWVCLECKFDSKRDTAMN